MLAPIAAAPEVVSTLPTGTVLSGSILNSNNAAALQILTKYGQLELATKLALPEGAKVALQIRDGGQVHLQIVGPKPALTPQGSVRPGAETPVQLSSQVLTATLETALISRLAGTGTAAGGQQPAYAGNADAAQLPAILRNLPAGAQFQVQVTALPSATPATTTAGSNAVAPQTATLSQAVSTTANPVLQGNVIASGASSGTLPAAVSPSGTSSRTVLQSGLGILSLSESLKLPPGARVEIQILAKSLPQALPAAASPDTAMLSPGNAGFGWPSLETLARRAGEGQISSALAGQVMQRVPAAGAQLSSNILFLLSALNAGQVNGWLGRSTLDQLQREGQNDLVNRLDGDLTQAGRIADSNSGEWRALILPFLDDGQIRQLRLFLRRRDEDKDGEGKEGPNADATRFLLEIELRKLGDLQADGLIRAKLFDLILRTRRPFSRPMREEITRIFTESNHSLGLAGQILFEASDDWQPAAAKAGGLQAAPDLMI